MAGTVDEGREAFARQVWAEAHDFLADAGKRELGGLLRGAGFHDVTVETTTKTLRLPPPADFLWQYIHATPMAALVAADDDRREKLESDVVAQWHDFVDGSSLVYDQPVLTATARK